MYHKVSIFIFLLFLLSGCREASKVLQETLSPKTDHYPATTKALQACDVNLAIRLLQDNPNKLLKNSELGLGNYFKRNYLQSNSYFDKAISRYRSNENKAIFDLSTFIKKEYQVEGYDKVLLHNYKAINYLLLDKSESARVEARNSNILQQEERNKLNDFKEKYDKNNQNMQLASRYERLFNHVNATHNPYQNPFAYYISALSYAEDNDYDNALIDIKHAITLLPNTKILTQKQMQYRQDKSKKTIELFFDVGQSPLKSQVRMEMDMGNGEKRMTYLPSFILNISNVDHVKIIDSKKQEITRTSLLVDINAIKINAFKEKLPSILYLISKEASTSLISNALSKESQLISTLFKVSSTIYGQNSMSTWSFLPEKILVASFSPKTDEHYSIVVVDKQDNVIETQRLQLASTHKTTNRYEHFTIRNQKICN